MAKAHNPVLILGGGINGAAVARELLLNGIPVCLVDLGDLACGATAYSSRLIHGGLRYLEYADFSLVRESLTERDRLFELAPQFVRPLRFFIPLQQRSSGLLASGLKFFHLPVSSKLRAAPRGLWAVRSGLKFYDLLTTASSVPRHKVHSLDDPAVPTVDRERFRWVCSYYDGQIRYPERFVVSLLRDSRNLAVQNHVSFRVFTYHQAVLRGRRVELYPVAKDDSEPANQSAQATVSLQPSMIINATGAWVDKTLQTMQIPEQRLMGGTKGSHLLLLHEDLKTSLKGQAVYAEAGDGRPVFFLPFEPFVLVGTTDIPFEGDPADAVADKSEVDYLLASVRQVFPNVDISHEHVFGHHAGVRPLPFSDSSNPASVTRRHVIKSHRDTPVPLVSLIGGKLTTCRQLAEETASHVIQELGDAVEHVSRERPIPGGESYPDSETGVTNEWRRIAAAQQLELEQVRAVWSLCGTLTQAMLSQRADDDEIEREKDSVTGTDLPRRFVQRVIQEEWCTNLTDLVERRLMLLFQPRLSLDTLVELAQLMVHERELAAEEVDAAVSHCRQRLEKHFGMKF
jgi:glycerol-3-phosphate dehydrogenase